MLCALCSQKQAIKNSHVIPKFVFKRLKAGSPLDTIRNSQAINKPYQDGWKGESFCTDCEARFGSWEDWFVKELYDPFLGGNTTAFEYDERLALFAASLHFRNYVLQMKANPSGATLGDVALCDQLRRMCLASDPRVAGVEQYVQLLSPVRTIVVFPAGVNTYLFESVDPVVVQWPDGRSLSFVKLPYFLFVTCNFGLDTLMPEPHLLDSHAILSSGNLTLASQSGVLLVQGKDHVIRRTKDIQENYKKMSPQQFQKIQDAISAVPDREKTRAHQSFELDVALLKMQPND